MKRPLLPPTIAIMAGIVLAEYWEGAFPIALAFLALTLTGILIASRRILTLALVFVWASFFLLGFIHMRLIIEPPRDRNHIFYQLDGNEKTLEGVIVDLSEQSETGSLLTVSLYRLYENSSRYKNIHGQILLSVRTDQVFSYGDVIRFKTQPREPKSFQNPGVFDYKKYLQYRGIWVRGSITRPTSICLLRSGYGSPLIRPFMGFRQHLSRFIMENAPFPASTIIQACILGLQRNIPAEIWEKFNRTGTSHIIAISGFNMAIVAGFAALATRAVLSIYPPLLLRLNLQLLSTVVASLFVLFYTFVAGAGISVLRATITILVFMFALILGRVREAENTLALAAIVILLFSPYLLFDLSFQLSFSAVYALIYITPRLMDLLPPLEEMPPLMRKIVRAVYAFLAATAGATLGTLPVLIYHFHRLSPLVLVSNALVVPILGFLVVPLSMVIMITFPLSAKITGFIVYVTAKLVDISVAIVDFLSALPYSSLLLTPIGYGQIALYLIALIFFISALGAQKYRPLKFIASGTAAFLLALSLAWPINGHLSGQLKLTILDVGQGQAIFLQLPGRRAALIDGGGSFDSHFDIGKNVIAPFLLRQGVCRLSRIVVSHPHPDHVGGLLYIVKNFPVQEIWVNEDFFANENTVDLRKEARARAIPIRVIAAAFSHEAEDHVKWEIIHPPSPLSPPCLGDENDRSLVIRITYGTTSFLVPGDITEEAEKFILQQKRPIKSQVLIVPHHGSRHSSTPDFIEKVAPLYACVSAGGGKSPHLPHPDTIERFRDRAIPLYRTDKHGAVTFYSDGESISVQTFVVAYDR
ncbi:MAG TPA: DNA internalization-related competence protein ComEC/Rec2 [Syntrophales bacterium]|mgnify:CR=1 FL=1|nr:DNA internalization-related competence protein ComEC/Rec2 [Syntrophales bacterium]HOL58586.1 DNA internalization-related competence protein ComEC/Rec2 [Syntrophales bacterium]HPO34806.1 DNA internalization-related competence protein ComEC/Rec2 [Syntrophales bacterium]